VSKLKLLGLEPSEDELIIVSKLELDSVCELSPSDSPMTPRLDSELRKFLLLRFRGYSLSPTEISLIPKSPRLARKPLMNTQCVGDEFYFLELVPTRTSLFVAHLS
jgi:hypothetical protein